MLEFVNLPVRLVGNAKSSDTIPGRLAALTIIGLLTSSTRSDSRENPTTAVINFGSVNSTAT
jgi:hypothetical protein